MIEALEIPYIVEIEDLNKNNENIWEMLAAYHSYQEIIDLADSLAGAFPGFRLCEFRIWSGL